MAEKSRPWNGTTIGDAGPYSDADWQEIWRYIIGLGGNRPNVGVFAGSGTPPNDGLRVTAPGGTATVELNPGAALLRGLVYINTAVESLNVSANASGNPRIDMVVLQADYALQEVHAILKAGTPAASPAAPALVQNAGVLWEIPIAYVAVANGFSSISQSNITSVREFVNAAPRIVLSNMLNNSGSTLVPGDLVTFDLTADKAITLTTTRDLKSVAGIWQNSTVNGGYGDVLRTGIAYVYADAAVTRGDLLMSATTVRQVTKPTTGEAVLNCVVGRALETTSGAGYVLAAIDVNVVSNTDMVVVQDQKASGAAAQTLTVTTWNARVLNTLVLDTGSIASLGSNRVTLPRGRYTVTAHAGSGGNLGSHRLRLRDPINNVTILSGSNALNNSTAQLSGVFELAASTIIELQHYPAVGSPGGTATSTGEPEIYASLTFTRHGRAQS